MLSDRIVVDEDQQPPGQHGGSAAGAGQQGRLGQHIGDTAYGSG